MAGHRSQSKFSIVLIWGSIASIIGILLALYLSFSFQSNFAAAPLPDFDKMMVTDGFHQISLASGQHWQLSYEQNQDRIFEGTVRFASMDHETNYPILSHDILITSRDFASPVLVSTNVENHHFSWVPLTDLPPQGTINLLHTIPMNQAVETSLARIRNGDQVVIQAWDILKIDAYSRKGDFLGYWTDEGCNTVLVTSVIIK